jgi:hypothetical protein
MRFWATMYIISLLCWTGMGSGHARSLPGEDTLGGQKIREEIVDNMLKFVTDNAVMAGALGVCSPPKAQVVHDCVVLVLNNWINFARPFDKPEEARNFVGLASSVWTKAQSSAYAIQSGANAPKPCGDILIMAHHSKLWSLCRPSEAVPQGNISRGPQVQIPEGSPERMQ